VTVTAGLIAELAHVDLQDIDRGGLKGPQTLVRQRLLEVLAHLQLPEPRELSTGVCER
jgi:hypothetical protein